MARILRIVFAAIIVCAFGLPDASFTRPYNAYELFGISSAHAQQAEKKKRRSLLSILFGKRTSKKKAVTKKSSSSKKRRARTVRRKTSRSRARATRRTSSSSARRIKTPVIAQPEKEVVEKIEDAKKILVVGDFFAGGLADGLKASFSDVANLVVVDKANGLSGFVRNDIVDWPTALGPMIEEIKPAYIVAMLGSNDRQLMVDEGKKLKKRTPEWDAAYAKRVESLGVALKASGLPYTWMGLPPVRFKTMNSDFLVFNELYAKAAKSEKGDFIDVWDGFSDADGNYSRSGPDVNGQITLLRSKDGINLTSAGRSRLSFYVEGQILQTLGGREGAVDPGFLANRVDPSQPKPAVYNPAQTGRTLVVSLDDPSADGGDVLAGEKVIPGNGAGKSAAQPVLNEPVRAAQKQGRVDNFVWPPVDQTSVAPASTVAVTN